MDTSSLAVAGMLHQLSMVIGLVTRAAVLVFALAVVFPRHRAAGSWIAAAAGMLLLASIGWGALPFLLKLTAWSFSAVYAVADVALAIWSAAAWLLLAVGLLSLCAAVPRAATPRLGG